MKQSLEVKVEKGCIEPYIVTNIFSNIVDVKVTFISDKGLEYWCYKDNVHLRQLFYMLGFCSGICLGQYTKDMLVEMNFVSGILNIEIKDI